MAPSDPILTLSDLAAWSFAGTPLAVLGHPIKHSISPPMHNAALAEMASLQPVFGTWRYFRFDVPPEELPKALEELHARGFHGLNLTVPHKILAFDRVESVDDAARPIGAVNTLRRTATGWHGFNTDGYGLATAVREALGVDLGEVPIVLLGAGGAARGAAVECLRRGCPWLGIANRTAERRDELLRDLAPVAGQTQLTGFDPHGLTTPLPPGALVINATSAGLRPDDPAPFDLARLERPLAVYDMIYNPPLTPLLQQAKSLALPCANGLGMLVHQGVRALELWSEAIVPVEVMRSAAFAAS